MKNFVTQTVGISLNGKISLLEYLLMFLFVVLCGFTSHDLLPFKSYFIMAAGLFMLITRRRHIGRVPMAYVVTALLILVVAVAHRVQYGVIDSVLLNYLAIVTAGYLLIVVLGQRFPLAYLNVMSVLSVVSLACYALMMQGTIVHIDALCGDHTSYQGIFIWNVRRNELEMGRNCGPFWEPGAFAGYLIMVGVLWFGQWRDLWQYHRRKVVVIVLALATTFSSQGYIIAISLVAARFVVTRSSRRTIPYYFALMVVLSMAFILYQTLPFLQEKVNEQLELTEDWESDASLRSANRFTTTMVDIENIRKNPLWGNTSDAHILYRDYPTIMHRIKEAGGYGSGSGSTNYAASNGLLMLVTWLVLCFLSLSRYYDSRRRAIVVLLVILMLGQAEMYNAYIFYQSIPFLGLMKPK